MGIDAVFIDDEQKKIMLFNFKYREKFNINKSQELSSVIDCSKFLNAIYTENTKGVTPITKGFIKEIIKRYNSETVWETELFLVSNENNPIDLNTNEIQSFIDSYDLKIKYLTLNEIIEFISDKPDDISSKFIVDRDSVLVFEEDSISSSKSYLVKFL